MAPEPLWALADEIAAEEERLRQERALSKILHNFRELNKHPTYGRYGAVGASRMNRRSHDGLLIAAYLADWGPIEWTQGGLNPASAKSARTHVGLGTTDIVTKAHPRGKLFDLVEAAMLCGNVIFIRGITYDKISDGMVEHGHTVTIGGNDKHPDAAAQITNTTYGYAHGGAGLAGLPGARWFGPDRKALVTWEQSKYNPANGWRP